MSERLHIWSADRLLVCVPADLGATATDALRSLFHGDPTVERVLEVLTADGLGAAPPFVCASAEPEGVRVVIRGELHAVAHGADGSALTLGAGRAATWNDDVVTDIVRISVELAGGIFEWIAGAAAPAAEPVAEPVELEAAEPVELQAAEPVDEPAAPAATPESHTLDEHEFERLVGSTAPAEVDDTAAPEPSRSDATAALDFSSLLDDTSHRPPAAPPISAVPRAGAPAPSPPARPEPPTGRGTGLGEHDGRTVTLADLRRLQREVDVASPEPAPPAGGSPRSGEVRAVRCPVGHANPPTATTCRICEDAIADTSVVSVPRPVIARLVFDSGLVVDVDRPQLIGRRPAAPPEADEIPNLITIPSPDSDISRVHTAVRVAGWDLLVEDAGSTNGTEVRLPAREPMRLREHDPVLVVPGTEVVLAGAVRFVVERPER